MRVLGPVVMFLILFASKLVILELVDIVFGDHVDLGGFLEIIAIAIALMAVEHALQWVFAPARPPLVEPSNPGVNHQLHLQHAGQA